MEWWFRSDWMTLNQASNYLASSSTHVDPKGYLRHATARHSRYNSAHGLTDQVKNTALLHHVSPCPHPHVSKIRTPHHFLLQLTKSPKLKWNARGYTVPCVLRLPPHSLQVMVPVTGQALANVHHPTPLVIIFIIHFRLGCSHHLLGGTPQGPQGKPWCPPERWSGLASVPAPAPRWVPRLQWLQELAPQRRSSLWLHSTFLASACCDAGVGHVSNPPAAKMEDSQYHGFQVTKCSWHLETLGLPQWPPQSHFKPPGLEIMWKELENLSVAPRGSAYLAINVCPKQPNVGNLAPFFFRAGVLRGTKAETRWPITPRSCLCKVKEKLQQSQSNKGHNYVTILWWSLVIGQYDLCCSKIRRHKGTKTPSFFCSLCFLISRPLPGNCDGSPRFRNHRKYLLHLCRHDFWCCGPPKYHGRPRLCRVRPSFWRMTSRIVLASQMRAPAPKKTRKMYEPTSQQMNRKLSWVWYRWILLTRTR